MFQVTIMKEIKPEQLTQNIIDLIGHQWMLITAGNSADYNMMTASWGGMGYLWNKPVATIYVRPERLTDQYINNSGRFTLTFFPQSMRPTLTVLGTKSGREYDKMNEPALSPLTLPSGQIAFQQAHIIIECEILYKDAMAADKFTDTTPLQNWYGPEKGNLHNIYIAEIKNVWINQ